ncbi:MAG: hypothetical protein D6773_17895, partial [Alphaproteobacteria bacterium]
GYASEHILLDQNQTVDGFGLIRLNKKTKRAIIECWPHHQAPDTGTQHKDWPVKIDLSPK